MSGPKNKSLSEKEEINNNKKRDFSVSSRIVLEVSATQT